MIDVLILCGGRGTRVSHLLGDIPKFLAPLSPATRVCDRVLTYLRSSPHVRYVALALSHGRERIIAARLPVDGLSIQLAPMGTTDATRRALTARYVLPDLLTTDPILVVNGDTLWDVDLELPIRVHRTSGVLVTRVYARDHTHTLSHAGLRFLSQEACKLLRSSTLPDLDDALAGSLAFEPAGSFIDVGTPDGLSFARGSTTCERADDMHQGPVPASIDVADRPRLPTTTA